MALFDNCGVRAIKDKIGRVCIYENGYRICNQEGYDKIQLIDHYLNPVRDLQKHFRRYNDLKNVCDVTKLPGDLRIVKVLSTVEKDSSSNSIIALASWHETEKLILKISFEERFPRDDNSLQVERKVYRDITTVLQKYTPNLVPFVAVVGCNKGFVDTLVANKSPIASNIYRQMQHISDVSGTKYDYQKAHILVTHQAKGDTLDDWFRSVAWRSWKMVERTMFMRDVLFQVAYALVVFDDVRFKHGDLHTGNIFVEQMNEPLHLSFGLDRHTIVSRNINFFVRIYDFDRSSLDSKNKKIVNSSLIPRESVPNLCHMFGDCNDFRELADWFTILHFIYIRTEGDAKLMERIFPRSLLRHKGLAYTGRACERRGRYMCDPIDLDRHVLQTPFDYLLHNHFDFRTKCQPDYERPVGGYLR